MNKQLIVIVLLLVLAACSPTPTSVPVLSPASNIPTTVSSPIPLQPSVVPAMPAQITETAVPVTEPEGTLALHVLAPQDEAVLNSPQVEVIGSAPAGAVVSINDEILIVGADGQFKTTISLDEGPNLLEIVASDENGNEDSLILTVTYEP